MGERTSRSFNIPRIVLIHSLLSIMIFNSQIMGANTALFQENSGGTLSQSNSNPPIIEWSYGLDNSTLTPVIAWDGAYTGQTEEVWRWTHWVNDTDGVDTVLFRFSWGYDDEWFNRSTVRVEGNSTHGRYHGNLTWGVAWNWAEGRPEWVDGSGNFQFKIFANDTLGNWIETSLSQYMGGYMLVNPPPLHYISIIGQFLIIPAIVVIVLVIVWKRRIQ